MKFTSKQIVLLSPFLILITNLIVAIVAGEIIGKWAFVPMMLFGWAICSHFLVDFFNLSVPAFLDLFEKGSW